MTRYVSLVVIAVLGAWAPAAESQAPTAAPAAYAHTIYLVRHGSCDDDPKADPALGPSLNTLGIAQARLIAARLRGMPFHFDSMTSSTMTRARETATIIHDSLGEVMFGGSARFSECMPPAIRKFPDEKPEEQAACAQRLDEAFAAVFVPKRTATRNDLIVAHGNVIRYFVMKALKADTRLWPAMSVAHASLTVIRVKGDGTMSVLAIGDVGHIPPNLQSWGGDADPRLATPAPRP
ncbi:MAG TPA: histidine phosphatase family protein [Steroidobacteraceae bacterium]|nr:histidine phosphatase family protein [Steroidobacteraceae bacterium]